MSKGKGGRPKLPDSEKRGGVQVYLTPDERDYLRELGCGNPSAGVRILIAKARGEKTAVYCLMASDPDGVDFRLTGKTFRSREAAAGELNDMSLPPGARNPRVEVLF